MPYVIQRDDGKYVAPVGSEHSYVDDAFKARQFHTGEAAMQDAYENEQVWYCARTRYFIPKD